MAPDNNHLLVLNMAEKTIKLMGKSIKEDNGSGRRLSGVFQGRKFHDNVIYNVTYVGNQLDNSTVAKIERSKNGW